MRFLRVALPCIAVVAVGILLVSGGSGGDPRTPAALPGLPPPFLGTAVTGDGGLTAAVDAYGDVVDLRSGPAGTALIDNPSDRQAAGTVSEDTGIVPRLRIDGGPALAMWQADSVAQRYLSGTNVVRTVGRFGDGARLVVTVAAAGDALAVGAWVRVNRGRAGAERPGGSAAGTGSAASGTEGSGNSAPDAVPSVSLEVEEGVSCAHESRAGHADLICKLGRHVPPDSGLAVGGAVDGVIRSASVEARGWVARSKPLGVGAPRWAREMYQRSLLTIHALTSGATGAVAAGARDGWAYVWPRDAATGAVALQASGHTADARRVAHFLTGLDLSAAARFDETGAPIPGRAAQGDGTGWVTVAADATGVQAPSPLPWRDRADYQESTPGTYLGNALAATAPEKDTPPSHPRVDGPKTGDIGVFSAHQHRAVAEGRRIGGEFGSELGLVRVAGDPGSGLDSAAGWAVRPFGLRALYPQAERTLRRLVGDGTRYGITPGEGWEGGDDPWMAPTAWSAWAFAGLAAESGRSGADREARGNPWRTAAARRRDRLEAISLLRDLRRASTPAGALPERVGAQTGIPTSTTPLVWPSAFAALALRELWP